MSYLLTCPNCGVREVTDFGFGGEVSKRPSERPTLPRAEHLHLLQAQRGGRAARVVEPPLRLPCLVLRRAQHGHQRGPLDRAPRGRARARGGRLVSRLDPQPDERIDRSRVISFTFDGKRVEAYEGDTVGSALYAAGQRTFSRSFKYHRRRGLLCCAGQCPNCLVAVDGAPGARACVEPVREGMRVEHLNASPSLDFDVMRATDLFGGPFTPPGFYYKTFIRPRRLWPLYEKFLRHAAGLGAPALAAGGPRVAHATTAAATPTCSSPAAASPGSPRRSQRPSSAPTWCWLMRGRRPADRRSPRAGPRAPERSRAGRGGRRGGPLGRERPGALRRDRARLAGRHAAPGARAPPRLRDRGDRAAARLRRQRPARRDALRRGSAADLALRRRAGVPGGGRDDLGPRARRRPGPARRRRRDRRRRGPPRDPGRRGGRAGRSGDPRAALLHGARGARAPHGERRGDRPRRGLLGRRGDRAVRPGRRQRRGGPGDLAGAAGRGAERATTRSAATSR